jgi:peptide methionine sulfoxide reductase msrA/msrB
MMKKIITSLSLILLVLISGCTVKMDDSSKEGTGMVGEGIDATYVKEEGQEVIYLAGGCFWGMEKLASCCRG